MTGIDRSLPTDPDATATGPEFPPILDLVPVLIGAVGLVAASIDAAPDGGFDAAVSLLRTSSERRSSVP